MKFNKIQILNLLCISCGILLRIYWMVFHFTHYDDIGFINCLLYLKKQQQPFIKYFDWGWTYAPLQVPFTSLLIKPSFSYQTNIVLGRLPSCFFGVLSIILVFFLVGKLFDNATHKKLLQLLATFLISFSWENIIYSAQAEPYTIGVTVSIILIMYFLNIIKNKNFSTFNLILISTLAFYSQYQIVIILVPMYISLFLFCDKHGKKKLVLASVISSCLCFPLLQSFWSRGLLARGINWNQGNTGEFLFPVGQKIFHIETLKWFLKNSYIYIQNFFVSNQENLLTKGLTVFWGTVFILGFYFIHKDKERRALAIFIDLVGMFFTLFIVTNKLTYSPSRHTLIFYPIILVPFLYGYNIIFQKLTFKSQPYAGVSIWLILHMAVWIMSGYYEFPARYNFALNGKINDYLDMYQPESIVVYTGFDLQLMDLPEYKVSPDQNPLGISTWVRHENAKPNIMLLSFGNTPIAKDNLMHIQEHLYNVPPNRYLTVEQVKEGIIDEYILQTDTEVEYAKGRFSNTPNGLHIYILQNN